MLYAVIMAGGAGTRFWPESRAAVPKQLLALAGERTMLQATFDRLQGLVPAERIFVITNQALVPAVREQLPDLPTDSVVGEPCKRDTAPCVGLAAELVARRDPDATMLVMPSDHVITPTETFQSALRTAAGLVADRPERIVTFGIRPTYPAESFGYIERGEPIEDSSTVFQVVRFREKPNAATAQAYLDTKRFYWNAGIFVWRAATLRGALQRFQPEMSQHLATIGKAIGTANFATTLHDEFHAIQGKSVDFAVMEHYDCVLVMEAPFQWDDVGSWQAMGRVLGSDSEGNTLIGRNIAVDTRGTIVKSDREHLVVTLGLKDCIVVRTPDATLVANKHDEESIRKVVEILRAKGWHEFL